MLMELKPAIKTFGLLLVLLALVAVGVLSSAAAMNYGFKTDAPAFYGWAGLANLACWALALVASIYKSLKEEDL